LFINKALKIAHTTSCLLDASTDMDKWSVFLESGYELINAQGGAVAHFRFQNKKLNFNLFHNVKGDIEELKRKSLDCLPTDPINSRAGQTPGKPHTCRQLASVDEIYALPYYKEIFIHTGMEA